MTTVIFETETAIFQFDLLDVQKFLAAIPSEEKSLEVTKIERILESSVKDIEKVLIDNEFFAYITLDLLGNGKGSVFCKSCQKSYQPQQLHPFPLGFGESPFTIHSAIKERLSKKIFGKEIKGMGMFGGKEFQCPKGHELISMITWIS